MPAPEEDEEAGVVGVDPDVAEDEDAGTVGVDSGVDEDEDEEESSVVEDSPPVMVVPVIGMGSVMGVGTDVALEEVEVVAGREVLEEDVEFSSSPPVIRVIAKAGLALPESPKRTMI